MRRVGNYKSADVAWARNPPIYEAFCKECYEPKVTLPLHKWREYVATGKNTLYAGAIIPAGTEHLPGDVGGGAVYSGHVRQGYLV